MQIQENTIIQRHNLQSNFFVDYVEKENKLRSKSGGMLYFRETSFDGLQFIRCDYNLAEKELFYIDIENEVLEMHFRFNGTSNVNSSRYSMDIHKGNNMLTYATDSRQEVLMHPTTCGGFLEIRIGLSHFEKLMDNFDKVTLGEFVKGYPLTTSPEMFAIIAQIDNTYYSGKMKALFLEAKMTELFLLQLQEKQQLSIARLFSYKTTDKEKIYEAKFLIDEHINEFITISYLAQSIGINKRKLMQGFKELFGTTIFVYITNLKMEKAKHYLLNENKFVYEVADLIGYKNPQHFISAFKKKFGISPSKLKE